MTLSVVESVYSRGVVPAYCEGRRSA